MTYLGNLGGTFTGDVASLTRLATSAPFSRYVQEEIFHSCRLITSGAAMTTDQMLVGTNGTRIEAPFFRPLDPVEEIMASSDSWGVSGEGHFTVQKMRAATQHATITHRGFAYGVDKLSKIAIGEDPLEVLGRQLAQAMNKLRMAKFVAHMEGLLGTGGPLNATNNVNKSVTTGSTISNWLTAPNIVEARYKLNERQESIRTLVMHSLVAAYLEEVGFLAYDGDRKGVNKRQSIGIFGDLNVIVDDLCPVIGTSGQQRQFVCYLVGNGVMREGDQVPMEIEEGRNPLSKQNYVVVDYHHVQHVPGTSWSSALDNPTNAQIATGSNFALAYQDPRLISAVRLVVNSPYGGTI